jgi:superfamily II DNA or RNA helicase
LIADEWLQRSEDHRVLVLAHERQLIQQFADEIEEILGERPAIEMAHQRCTGAEKLIVASRQTLRVNEEADKSRLYKFDPKLKWLLILDEAHRWARKLPSCRPIIEYFEQNKESVRLGLTATPERTDKTTLAGLFPGIASDYRLYDVDGGPSAVNDGWAVPYDQRFIVVEGVDFKNLREIAKDFDKGELERVLGESETLARLVRPMLDLVGERRTIIFNPGTAMAKNVALYLNAKLGYEAALSLDGTYPDEVRRDAYRRHKRGDFQFLSVCGLCREGYNDPGIQAVAVFRPTKSRPLAEQMKGRGCRPLKGIVSDAMGTEGRKAAIAASDKPNCMVIDLVGITGIADCASTASIMAGAKPDEVIERANENMLKKRDLEEGPVDVAEEIRQAEFQIKEEREKARREREERQRREQEEMNKRARLQEEVRYSQRQVQSGHGGRVKVNGGEGASKKQLGYLWYLGMRMDLSGISKGQAGRMISLLKSGKTPQDVAYMSGLVKRDGAIAKPKQSGVDVNALFQQAAAEEAPF